MPDLGAAETFLLLDECPDCGATVPITRVATLTDLGAYLDADDPGYTPRRDAPTNSPTTPPTAPNADSRPDLPPRTTARRDNRGHVLDGSSERHQG